jgi:uncharacterized protein
MIIELDRIREDGDRFIGTEPKAIMDLAQEPDMDLKGDLRYDLTLLKVDETVDVRGVLELDIAFRCSRCAEFFDTVVREPDFEAVVTAVGSIPSIDLTEELREAILLAFPTFPVCSSACKGLCSQCGANLNRETCNCRPPEQDQWHGLGELNTE